MQLGGAPRCAACGGAVYHAEQVMGPARKIYHKPCLKCMQCGKRLDPGGLVEHDTEPYCTRCHTTLYGTRDLRHANVLPSSPANSPARTPAKTSLPPQGTNTPIRSTPLSPRAVPPPQDFYTPPNLDHYTPSGSAAAARPSPYGTPSYSTPSAIASNIGTTHIAGTPTPGADGTPSKTADGTSITRPDFRAGRPISVPFSGRPENLDDRGLLRRTESPRTKVGERLVADDSCWGCEKRVYAAEQVLAIGKKWHRGCLRCCMCKNSLTPANLSDRDSKVYCKNCYHREHGPGGIR